MTFPLTLTTNEPLSAAEANARSMLALAHVGDAVFELLVRSRLAARSTATVQELHRRTVGMAQVKDVNTIADPEKKAYAKKLNIIAGKDYILHRDAFRCGQDFVDAVKRAEQVLK